MYNADWEENLLKRGLAGKFVKRGLGGKFVKRGLADSEEIRGIGNAVGLVALIFFIAICHQSLHACK